VSEWLRESERKSDRERETYTHTHTHTQRVMPERVAYYVEIIMLLSFDIRIRESIASAHLCWYILLYIYMYI